MQILFTRWCIDPKRRTPVSVEPTRVDCVEYYGDAFTGPLGEFPAACVITLKNKQQFTVQGSVTEVVTALNAKEAE